MQRLRRVSSWFRRRRGVWVDGPSVVPGLKLKIPDTAQPGDLIIAAIGNQAFELVDGQWQEIP